MERSSKNMIVLAELNWLCSLILNWFWKEYFFKGVTYITKHNTLLETPFELDKNVGRDYVAYRLRHWNPR